MNAAQFELSSNFRSQPEIVRSAKALIKYNPGKHLPLKAEEGQQVPVEYMRPDTAFEEAQLVMNRIDELIGGSQMHLASSELIAPSEIAVLYRSAVVGELIKEKLQDSGLPVEVRGEHLLQNRAHRILIPLLTQLVRPDKLLYLLLLRDMGVIEPKRMRELYGRKDWKAAIAQPDVVYNIDHQIRRLTGTPVARALDALALEFSRYLAGEEGAIAHLAEIASTYGTDINGFLEQSGSNPYVVTGSLKPQGLVLSTFHGVKGLEFDTVFIIHANEGVTPSIYNDNTEEERRLFYVAMTRARKRLYISAPENVKHPDGRITGETSRFISELGAHLKEKQVRKPQQLTLF
jgi:superfamily I DNA/RNA helicase